MRTKLAVALVVLAGCGEGAAPPPGGEGPAGAEGRGAATPGADGRGAASPGADGRGAASPGANAAGCPPSSAVAGAGECVLRVGRERRRYVLHAPAGDAPVPLIVALHGVGGPAANPAGTADASRLHERPGIAVAYADGEGTWAARRDDPYFPRVLDDVARRRAIDPRRVFVVGWSGGGFMAHRVACRLAARVAAVAVLHAPLRGPCAPERPVSVLQIVGARDPFIPVAGGETPDGTHSPPVGAAMTRWRTLNGCSRARASERDGAREVTARCAAGTTVTLRALADGEHTWYADATERILRFFTARRRT